MSDPHTEAYFALTRTEPAGHCSMSGFGDGSTASLPMHVAVPHTLQNDGAIVGNLGMMGYSQIGADQSGGTARAVQGIAITGTGLFLRNQVKSTKETVPMKVNLHSARVNSITTHC